MWAGRVQAMRRTAARRAHAIRSDDSEQKASAIDEAAAGANRSHGGDGNGDGGRGGAHQEVGERSKAHL